MAAGPGGAGLSRRTVLRGAGGVAFVGASLAALKLPFFSVSGAQQDPATCKAADVSATDKSLVISNWPAYIDPIHKPDSTVSVFQQRTGISVSYTDDINDNAEFYAKVKNQLAACQPINRDMIVMTDWMAARLVGLGWVQKFDNTKTANFTKNILPNLRARAWDKDMVYAAPWQSGLTGMAYNGKVAKEIRTIDELLTRPDLKGKVAVLSEMRDTMGLLLLSNGKDPANFTAADFDAALDKLKKAVSSGQIRKFTGNDYKEDLAKGDLAACIAWSGDVIQLAAEEGSKVSWVEPEHGLIIWSDNLLIPAPATHRANAEQLIDYYYDPKVAAELAAWVNYICPVQGAQDEMTKIDPDLATNPLIFPDAATLAKTHSFKALTEDEDKKYAAKFEAVSGA